MILTLQEENSAAATLQHKMYIRDFKPTCHLVSSEVRVCLCQVSAVALAKKMFFKNKIRHIGSIFLFFSAKIFDLVHLLE